ncbi:MAG: DUF1345 domain-containing protein [Caulobacterales bacterium]
MPLMHWRLVVGVAVGLAAFAAASALGAPSPLRGLLAWNIGAWTYLGLVWTLFLTATEQDARRRAAREDERRSVILALVIVAVVASLAAIVAAMLEVKHLPAGEQAPVAGLAAFTLVTSWCVLQSVFALHYAHEHFRTVEKRGERSGIAFPGDPASSYLDFAYLAVCVGATGQVSDPNITTTGLRNLVTAHGVLSFFYNTAVLALGINILASLLSG